MAYKIFTEELKKEFLAKIKSPEFKKIIEETLKAEENGKFKVLITTGDLDRQGEVVDPEGLEIENYLKNPIVLWAHDYFSLPIGLTTKIEKKENGWEAEGVFAPGEANPQAKQIRELYDLGFIRAASIGFISKEMQGNTIVKSELLEWSFVPVPANPMALSTLSKSGLNVEELIFKGLVLKEDEIHLKPEPETEGDYIIIRVKDPDYFDPDSFRTIWISEEKGIKATIGCKKGEFENGKCNIGTEVQRYLFDKEKWTLEEAEAWVEEQGKTIDPDIELEKNPQEPKPEPNIEEGKESQTETEIKEGRVLSTKNRTLIQNCIDQMSQAIAALKELLDATEPPKSSEPGVSGAKQKSSFVESDIEELENWLFFRKVLQKINTTTADALRKARERL